MEVPFKQKRGEETRCGYGSMRKRVESFFASRIGGRERFLGTQVNEKHDSLVERWSSMRLSLSADGREEKVSCGTGIRVRSNASMVSIKYYCQYLASVLGNFSRSGASRWLSCLALSLRPHLPLHPPGRIWLRWRAALTHFDSPADAEMLKQRISP